MLVGADIFDKLIKGNGYYVDKTEILYELVEETRNEVTLFTRPRRFGKTLTMSMMESFFDIRRNSVDVFEGLNIMERTEFCKEWMNRYPVLFISLKDVEGLTFEKAYGKLKTVIANLCKKHTQGHTVMHAPDGADGLRPIRYAYLESDVRVLPADAELFHKLQYETFLRWRMQIFPISSRNFSMAEHASRVLSDLLWHTISYMDYHEDYYHAFVTGIFVGRGKYAVKSNKERGHGRPDVDLRDKTNRRAMLIEAKKSENKKRMGDWCDEAIRQIMDTPRIWLAIPRYCVMGFHSLKRAQESS